MGSGFLLTRFKSKRPGFLKQIFNPNGFNNFFPPSPLCVKFFPSTSAKQASKSAPLFFNILLLLISALSSLDSFNDGYKYHHIMFRSRRFSGMVIIGAPRTSFGWRRRFTSRRSWPWHPLFWKRRSYSIDRTPQAGGINREIEPSFIDPCSRRRFGFHRRRHRIPENHF